MGVGRGGISNNVGSGNMQPSCTSRDAGSLADFFITPPRVMNAAEPNA
jgi:hypothetical protein